MRFEVARNDLFKRSCKQVYFGEKRVKMTVSALVPMALAALLITVALPLGSTAATDNSALKPSCDLYRQNCWWRINTDSMTILFPSQGRKPMFLWWSSNDTSNVYIVKLKGLIEYLTLDCHYYVNRYEAHLMTIQERLEAKYSEPMPEPYRTQIRNLIRAHLATVDLHYPYLPFSACSWNLSGPTEVDRNDGVSYISFNFTLISAPPSFSFAEDNVIIRCRFYSTEATENVYGLYNYTVGAGELKFDLVIRNWEWNIDRLQSLCEALHGDFNITVPGDCAGLALWADLASIEIADLPIAEDDAANVTTQIPETSRFAQRSRIQDCYTTSDIMVDGQRVQLRENLAAQGANETQLRIRDQVQAHYRLRFACGSEALPGFFNFVDQAIIINATSSEMTQVNVTAAYISAGNHLRLFIGYPYFADETLEHDPSIGLEYEASWIPTNALLLMAGAGIVTTGIAVAALRARRRKYTLLK